MYIKKYIKLISPDNTCFVFKLDASLFGMRKGCSWCLGGGGVSAPGKKSEHSVGKSLT